MSEEQGPISRELIRKLVDREATSLEVMEIQRHPEEALRLLDPMVSRAKSRVRGPSGARLLALLRAWIQVQRFADKAEMVRLHRRQSTMHGLLMDAATVVVRDGLDTEEADQFMERLESYATTHDDKGILRTFFKEGEE